MKGLGAIFFILMVGMLVIVSIWLFFIFFKVHVVGIAIDVDSINRYQEVPTMLLSSTLLDSSSRGCSVGSGVDGAHEPNDDLCTKSTAFHYMRSKVSDDSVLYGDVKTFVDNIKVSLPLYCYKIEIKENQGEGKVLIDGGKSLERFRGKGVSSTGCNTNQAKLNEDYPLPTFISGVPSVASQTLTIWSSTTTTDSSIYTWPLYSVEFSFGGGS